MKADFDSAIFEREKDRSFQSAIAQSAKVSQTKIFTHPVKKRQQLCCI